MTDTRTALVHQAWRSSMTYREYRNTIGSLLVQNKTTGPNQSPEYIQYTRLNAHRMNRLDKTLELDPTLVDKMDQVNETTGWLVITEAWCGDAANSIPVLEMMAAANEAVEMRLVLRDEHPELMDHFMTEGGRSIPKLIAFRKSDGHLQYEWGPRPEPAQQLMREYKSMRPQPPYEEMAETIQRWYNADKTQLIQAEVAALVAQHAPQLV